MPRQILPPLEGLSKQIHGIISRYRRMLDDEFLFGNAAQIPQVATIFDRIAEHPLHFQGEDLTLTELLTLIAYRYGFEDVRVMGNGGYAIVLGHALNAPSPAPTEAQRRVLRLVPDNHVRDIIARTVEHREFDVQLNADQEPVRDVDYPLLLSDLFLMPRHTTKLVFYDRSGTVIEAGGYPASLHCQLLPEVQAFNQLEASRIMAREAGELLESALATLGVSVADAHGGNGGVLIGMDGLPITMTLHDHTEKTTFVPVVLDYGYYAQIGARALTGVLLRGGITVEQVAGLLRSQGIALSPGDFDSPAAYITHAIDRSGLPRSAFGRLLYTVQPGLLNPNLWIAPAEQHWKTLKEKTYPALRAQSRLSRLYPDYDEVIFPQRIEEYAFTI